MTASQPGNLAQKAAAQSPLAEGELDWAFMTQGILFKADERLAARAAHEVLEQLLAQGGSLQLLQAIDARAGVRELTVPSVALRLLADALETLATGQAVELVPLVRGTQD